MNFRQASFSSIPGKKMESLGDLATLSKINSAASVFQRFFQMTCGNFFKWHGRIVVVLVLITTTTVAVLVSEF